MRVLKTEPRSMCPMGYNLVSYLQFPKDSDKHEIIESSLLKDP